MGHNFGVKETAWGKCPYSQEVMYRGHMESNEREFRCMSIHEDHDPKRLAVGLRVDKYKVHADPHYLNALMLWACDKHCPYFGAGMGVGGKDG